MGPLRILAAPDKFRGTATAAEVAAAVAQGAARAGAVCRELPLADGGEGTLEAFGGPNRATRVTGPLGAPIDAAWRLDRDRAVIEMALASGLLLAGGSANNDPIGATTRGTGELIAAALDAGAREILIGAGGSATTDGGAGALEILAPGGRRHPALAQARLTVCADVRTRFCDAATVFGSQKGATRADIAFLTDRLARLRGQYLSDFGIDVQDTERSGAAGGLAGGLAALGAHLADGFETIASAVGFDEALRGADLVVTGEGRFDAPSLDGKVVGGVIARARAQHTAVLVVCGSMDPTTSVPEGVRLVALADEFGQGAAIDHTASSVTDAVTAFLGSRPMPPANPPRTS